MVGRPSAAPDYPETGVPPEPCVNCTNQWLCADQQMACYTFARYCGSASGLGRGCFRDDPWRPSKLIYLQIFQGEWNAD